MESMPAPPKKVPSPKKGELAGGRASMSTTGQVKEMRKAMKEQSKQQWTESTKISKSGYQLLEDGDGTEQSDEKAATKKKADMIAQAEKMYGKDGAPAEKQKKPKKAADAGAGTAKGCCAMPDVKEYQKMSATLSVQQKEKFKQCAPPPISRGMLCCTGSYPPPRQPPVGRHTHASPLHAQREHTARGTHHQPLLLGERLRAHAVHARLPGWRSLSRVCRYYVEEDNWKACKKWVFFPCSPPKQVWDFVIMLCVFYSVAMVPYHFAFEEAYGSLFAFEMGVQGIFCLDVLLTFNTAVVQHEHWVVYRPRIAATYLSFWFWIDFPSSIPFELIDKIIEGEVDIPMEDVAPLLRVLRLFRMFRLLRLLKVWTRLDLT
jgi:hypothetical protein